MKSDILNNYDVIIFDCDGVILDVNLLKCEAFGEAVEGYPTDIVEKFVKHCRENFGISRYVKFKEFLMDFVKSPSFNEAEYTALIKKYASICELVYNKSHLTPGCEKLLNKLLESNKEVYVASGSDEKELNKVFTDKSLKKYFNRIYGSPKTKTECTAMIMNNKLNVKAVFIGDALSDLRTAQEHNIDFIYMSKFTVQSKEQDQLCRDGAKEIINTLHELI